MKTYINVDTKQVSQIIFRMHNARLSIKRNENGLFTVVLTEKKKAKNGL